jgi:hypothetical protein
MPGAAPLLELLLLLVLELPLEPVLELPPELPLEPVELRTLAGVALEPPPPHAHKTIAIEAAINHRTEHIDIWTPWGLRAQYLLRPNREVGATDEVGGDSSHVRTPDFRLEKYSDRFRIATCAQEWRNF